MGPFRERLLKDIYGTDLSTWFGLFRDDGKINDYTFVQGIRRGNFRLHPIGPLGLNEGCITLQHPLQFNYMRDMFLKSGPTLNISGSQLKAYGTVKVY
ncbi:tlde1 domain-containing protein [Pantoea agglomerans]|uniref:tlde1 domain-containing protein n=1 Tax=Enterobacter agglomerans TaxID=549 RepID=UPI003C7CC391